MRVGIIAANNVRYSPYIFFYTSILDSLDVMYELIVPDRNELKEMSSDVSINMFSWNRNLPTILNYIKYTNDVKRLLEKKKYDFIIALTSINAAFLGLWLKKHYNRKYIVDIRDYTHEDIYPFYLLEKVAVNNSLLNIISSRKFTEFLPQSRYLVCHNFSDNTPISEHFEKHFDPIRIGYVGGISYVEQCAKLMHLISKDIRFRLDFYGTSDQEIILKEQSKEYQCERIVFHGGYAPMEKEEILHRVDILFNAYGNGIPLLDYALSNKLYDSLAYKKPILTCSGTYMTEMAGPLAFPIDLQDDNALNDLYSWYQKTDSLIIDEYANRMIESIRRENDQTKEIITESILSVLEI